MIFRNAYFSAGGTALSSYIRSIEPSFNVETTDDTAMGDTTKSSAPALENWSYRIVLLNPFASSGPDATLWALRGSTFTTVFRPDTASAAATNPQWTGTGVISDYTPVSGSVGDEGMLSVTIVSAGALVRATS